MQIHRIDSLYPIRGPESTPRPHASSSATSACRPGVNTADARAQLVASIKRQIEAGLYDSPERLAAAAQRMLETLAP
jgi:hypothetical protein